MFAEQEIPLIHLIVGCKELRCWYLDERGEIRSTARLVEQASNVASDA